MPPVLFLCEVYNILLCSFAFHHFTFIPDNSKLVEKLFYILFSVCALCKEITVGSPS